MSSVSPARDSLSLTELRALYTTPTCGPDVDAIKRAFLFSARTGLRRSHLKTLRAEDTKFCTVGNDVALEMNVSGVRSYVLITRTLLELLYPEGGTRPGSLIFPKLGFPGWKEHLASWFSAAGIKRAPTFGIARRTFLRLKVPSSFTKDWRGGVGPGRGTSATVMTYGTTFSRTGFSE